MNKGFKIDIIGSGNLASNLAPALENAGASIKNVYSRNINSAQKLVHKLYEGEVIEDLDFSESHSDVILVAVSDNAIEGIAKEVILPENIILAHTSGSIPLSKLGYAATPNIGVFYPLQTFTKNQSVEFSTVPFLIEGDNKRTTDILSKLAGLLSSQVNVVSSAQRQQIHIAAIFASNFTNWMLSQSEVILQDANLNFNLMHALIAQSINNAIQIGPQKSQTGPAMRNDFEVLDNHMKLLDYKPELKNLYQLISQQILDHYQLNSDE